MPPIAVSLITSRAAARNSREQQQNQTLSTDNPTVKFQRNTSVEESSSTSINDQHNISMHESGDSLVSTTNIDGHDILNNTEEVLHGIDRKLFVSVLKRRSRRARHCRTLPLSALFYALFIWAMLIHVDVSPSYDMERG